MTDRGIEVLAPETEEERKELEALKVGSSTVERQANAMVVSNPVEYQEAGAMGVEVQTAIRTVEEKFKPSVDKAKGAYDEIRALRDEALAPLERAKKTLKDRMSGYNAEQRRIAQEAEAQRIRDQRKAEEEKRLQTATNLQEAGFTDAAVEVLDRPVAVAPVAPYVPPAKAAGTASKVTYGCRIVAPQAVKREFLIPDEKSIKALVKAIGPQAVEMVGGIEVYEEDQVSFRKQS